MPTMFEVLTVQVTAAGNNMENYSLIIEENGPGYKLNFQGQVNGEIYGKLEIMSLNCFLRIAIFCENTLKTVAGSWCFRVGGPAGPNCTPGSFWIKFGRKNKCGCR